MGANDYKAILSETLHKMAAVQKETERLEIESAKLRQFFLATLNMLPDSERAEFRAIFHERNEAIKVRESSLKNAIYSVLSYAYPKYLTSSEVRDRLRVNGFDFSGYTSNELASVSTTLRRFKPEEVESTSVEGVAAYRQKIRRSRMAEAFRKASQKRDNDKLKSFGGIE
jgi:hypothetical protein